MSYFTRYLCSNFCLILKEYKYSVFMEEVFLCFFSPQVTFKHLWGLSTGLMARSSLIGPLVRHSNLKWIYSVTSPYFSNSIIVVSTHISQCTYFKLVITKLLMNFTFQHFFSVFPSYYILFAYYAATILPIEQTPILILTLVNL